MKSKQWIGIIFASLVILSGCTKFNNRGVVEYPAFIFQNASNLDIEKVELNDTATVFYMKVYFTPHNWIRINEKSFLTDNHGIQYTIQSTEGIVLGEEFYMPESGEKEFSMIFPPVAQDATSVDFSEGDISGAWRFWGIQLTDEPLKVNLPKGFKDVAIDKNAVLPPVEFKAGKARLEGQILNFSPGMPAKLLVMVSYPFEYPPAEITLPVDSNGVFSSEIDAFSVHPASIYWQGGSSIQCFIAPGETTSLILNPAEISRKASRLADEKPSLGESVYYGGYMASIAKEFANINIVNYTRLLSSNELFTSFIQSLGKTPEEIKTSFMNEYRAKKAMLDTLDASPACKQIINITINLFYAADINNITSWLDNAYIYNNQIQNDREAIQKYRATRKHDIPDDFYNVLKEFSLINDPQMLYSQRAVTYVYLCRTQNMQSVLSKALGTDQGLLFDIMNVADVYNKLDLKPLSEEQIAEIPATFRDFIRNKNNELLQLIEANRNKTGFTVHDVENVANKDVFPVIFSKFKGKPILVDVWATWCGPCLMGNKEMKPMKEELAGRDIVYVFVTGPSSPLVTWENMIPDLPGEHFRLTKEQWEYIGKTFEFDGIPAYFFVDRKGNIKDKQVGYPGVQKMKDKLITLLSE